MTGLASQFCFLESTLKKAVLHAAEPSGLWGLVLFWVIMKSQSLYQTFIQELYLDIRAQELLGSKGFFFEYSM